jgi:hypothetical protein
MRKCTRNRSSRLGPRPGDFALGSLESRAAARAVQLVLDIEAQEQRAALFRNLTPLEQAFIEVVDDPRAQAVGLYLVRNVIIAKHQLFGLPLPTPEEVRHTASLRKEVAKIEQERAALGDTAFLDKKTLREMAEDRLRRERRRRAQTGSTTAEAAEAAD